MVAADQGAKALARMRRSRSRRRAGETRSEELLARTIGPSEYNGRSTECNVLLDRIFAGLGETWSRVMESGCENFAKSVEDER